ncbi:MAG: RNA polymerase sigma factor [Acidobacteria bacterium]|nr:RNA polymerase sigma factor [Acidobacteriota bacterium]
MKEAVLTQADFEAIYDRFGVRLRQYIRHQVHDPDLAADLLQETCLRLLRLRFQVRGERELAAYLYRTAYSVIVDHFRRERRTRRFHLFRTPEQHGFPRETTDVERAFGRLNSKERTLLWLAYVEEMNHSEISIVMDVGVGSVKVLLYRARKRLAARLEEYGINPEDPV